MFGKDSNGTEEILGREEGMSSIVCEGAGSP